MPSINSETIQLAIQLIERQSLTPDDAGCQEIMIARLRNLGFTIEPMRFDDVDNFWARLGDQEPLFAFAGHTDVVPTGPEEQWQNPPFTPTIKDDLLYGRGAADMKGSLACMIIACEKFLEGKPKLKGSIAFLITSDEEGPSINGTVKVVETLEKRQEKIDYCLVGEPSSTKQLGDVIKNGRRGSINGHLSIIGQQGHVAYPHLADNPVHKSTAFLSDLCNLKLDEGNEFFPPTSFQVSNVAAGTGVDNVIPGELNLVFNFRYSTETSADQIKASVVELLVKHKLNYKLSWRHSGLPFLTAAGALVEASRSAIKEVLNITTELSTAGGTSDGRFIAPTGAQVLELGPLNATIHQIDEHVSCTDLNELSVVYENILNKLLT